LKLFSLCRALLSTDDSFRMLSPRTHEFVCVC
jgi:hypothetical protein